MKQLERGFIHALIVLSPFIMNACTHDPAGIENMEDVCFDTQVFPVLKTSCGRSGCHDGSTEGFLLTDYNTVTNYVKPGDPRGSTLYRVITDFSGEGMMPPDQPLTKLQRSIIEVWIAQGAREVLCTTDTSGNGGHGNPNEICFVQDILPVMLSSCGTTGCHDAATHLEGYVYVDYQTIRANGIIPGNPSGSLVMQVVTSGSEERMPPSPRSALSVSQIAALRDWISKGAQNTDCPPATCDTSATISYATDIKPIMQSGCTGCHNSTLASGGINLADYSHVASNANTLRNGTSILIGAIKKQAGFSPMPPTYSLDTCSVAFIEKWISRGASNN